MPKGEKKCAHEPWKKSPAIGNNCLNVEPGDNAKYTTIAQAIFNMPDIDKRDPEQVYKRLNEFYSLYASYDEKPTVSGLAMALGMTRQTLLATVNDYPLGGRGYKSSLPDSCADQIKKAYKMQELLWDSYSDNGKINPTIAIFKGINNFNYRDTRQVEVVPQVDTQSATDYSAADIAKRYKITDGVIDTEKVE